MVTAGTVMATFMDPVADTRTGMGTEIGAAMVAGMGMASMAAVITTADASIMHRTT
jgi:hypothetical protein